MTSLGVNRRNSSRRHHATNTLERSVRYVMVLLAFMLVSSIVNANGFEDGVAAFDRKDYAKAMEIWKPLAEQGDARAQYRLGRMHEKGRGVWRNLRTAAQWYLKAAHQGNADAQYRLAVAYAYGLGGLDLDETRALMWLCRAAAQGQRKAQKVLAEVYERGKFGVEPDPERAAYWRARRNQ